jgi:peptidoglycan hydrolase-like protein with peptidoglycan-binding domain
LWALVVVGREQPGWWSWQSSGAASWMALAAPVAPFPPPDPGWPALAAGSKGDEVVWLQLHLASFDPTVLPTSTFDAATDRALRNLQFSRGLPMTGSSDPSTWQALLSLPLQPVDWTVVG